MSGPDGSTGVKMSWENFQKWQRWDEFPERSDNPPMTVDFTFWYREKKYFCTGEDYGYIIADEDWNRLAFNNNFRQLLEIPVFAGKSFHQILSEIMIEE